MSLLGVEDVVEDGLSEAQRIAQQILINNAELIK